MLLFILIRVFAFALIASQTAHNLRDLQRRIREDFYSICSLKLFKDEVVYFFFNKSQFPLLFWSLREQLTISIAQKDAPNHGINIPS